MVDIDATHLLCDSGFALSIEEKAALQISMLERKNAEGFNKLSEEATPWEQGRTDEERRGKRSGRGGRGEHDGLSDRTTAPVPKWEVLAGNKAV
jgi:hypothetical protein